MCCDVVVAPLHCDGLNSQLINRIYDDDYYCHAYDDAKWTAKLVLRGDRQPPQQPTEHTNITGI